MTSEQQKKSHPSLGRKMSVVGLFTLISRVAGLARDVVIAHIFGTQKVADAFYVAFRIPNMFRRLLAEGAMTMAFVPIYAEYREKSPEEAARAASTIFTALLGLVTLLVIFGVVAAPLFVKMIAYGFTDDPEKFALTVQMTRFMFPYLLCVTVMALMMGILNTMEHFVAPAAAPIIFNICLIFGAFFASRWFSPPVFGLVAGVLMGGVAQMLMQLPPLIKLNLLPRITFNLRHPSLRQAIRIMIPSLYGGAVYQLNVLVITLLASFLPTGSVSYLWYADRITEFPLGIFAVALATVSLPTLSAQRARGDMLAFARTLRSGFQMVLALSIPSAVGIIVLAKPIVQMLYQGGAFTAASTEGTVGAVICFAIGIPFISLGRNAVPAFYAMKDAKTPVTTASIALVVNAIFAFILMKPFLHQGLAIAMAISSAVQAGILLWLLRRDVIDFGAKVIAIDGVRCLLASIIMGASVWLAADLMNLATKSTRLELAPLLLIVIGVGVVTYGIALRFFAPKIFAHAAEVIRRKKR